MNHVIKRISLIAAEPCDGYTCPCADCQQYRVDLDRASIDPYAGHLDADELAAMDPLYYAEDGITEFDAFGPCCPCLSCCDMRDTMAFDYLRESWIAFQPTQELYTLQLPDAPARTHTHR